MTHPAEEASKQIMTALEACQAEPSLESTLTSLTQSLAKAQEKLFRAKKAAEDSDEAREAVRRAMEHLAQALAAIQDTRSDAPATSVAAASVAAALRILRPLFTPVPRESRVRSPYASIVPGDASRRSVPSNGDAPLSVNVNTMLSVLTDHQFYTGFSESIEQGGIFVATFEPEPVGAKVVVNFKLPPDRPITARGEVQWVREYNPSTPETAPGMGVKFTDLQPADRSAIEKFLETRAPIFYED